MANLSARERAEAAMEAEQWETAARLFPKAIEDNPDNHTLFGGRAKAFLEIGPQTAVLAKMDAQRSCMMDPTYMEGYLLYSRAELACSFLWNAEVGARKGLLIDPENALLIEQLERVQEARNNPTSRNPRCTVIPVYDAPDQYGFVYSHGLIWEGLPELLMMDVPSRKILLATSLIDAVATMLQEGDMNLLHGDTINVDGDRLQALMVSEEANRSEIINIGGAWNEEAEIVVLKLLDDKDNLPEPRDRETSIPPAPDSNETLLRSILDKWRGVESFTFLVDGEEENENEYNRMEVPLSFVLKVRSPHTNWDATFTDQEGRYTLENWEAIKHHARADLLGVSYELDGTYIQNIARHSQSPSVVQSRYRQGVKMATEE